ncbi:hypothetical protein PQR75_40835 [Paraburkholderia fungorum]|uniref:hypothetical protein n=1 Tax=Paraburkholderia fungorum TaxID=134537 RepID=UPI0038B86F09
MGNGSLADAIDIALAKLRAIADGYDVTSPAFTPLNAAVADLSHVLTLIETCASEVALKVAKNKALVSLTWLTFAADDPMFDVLDRVKLVLKDAGSQLTNW